MTLTSSWSFDRAWLLTWTTYGSWLPGDSRGFVSNAWDGTDQWSKHNRTFTPFDRDIPILESRALNNLRGESVLLTQEHAVELLDQLRETARYRLWQLLAAAIMENHCHLVVGVHGDPDPETLLRDFKSYGSRRLNRQFGRPDSGTWWTASGSRRRLANERSVLAAINYVVDQPYALVIWTTDVPELELPGGRLREREHRRPNRD